MAGLIWPHGGVDSADLGIPQAEMPRMTGHIDDRESIIARKVIYAVWAWPVYVAAAVVAMFTKREWIQDGATIVLVIAAFPLMYALIFGLLAVWFREHRSRQLVWAAAIHVAMALACLLVGLLGGAL
jgi:hypothetical protein